MKLYRLYRERDVSGCSGTGLVAEGMLFSNGRFALSWLPGKAEVTSVGVYDSIDDAARIHGHDGTLFVPVSIEEYGGSSHRGIGKHSRRSRRRTTGQPRALRR